MDFILIPCDYFLLTFCDVYLIGDLPWNKINIFKCGWLAKTIFFNFKHCGVFIFSSHPYIFNDLFS